LKIDVQFFSRLRDLVPAPDLSVDLPAGGSLGDLLTVLYGSYPALRAWDAHLLLAVGLDYAERSHQLHEGDAVSIMPPVQGG
jgi:molybdopterin converting factor small subunit